MATSTYSSGIKISFSNTPQATSDNFIIDEEGKDIRILDVMANDLGGSAKTLYSLDNGGDTSTSAELLVKDAASESASMDKSEKGVPIWITTDGKVAYDTTAIIETLQALGEGQIFEDSFTYAIRLSNGTLSWTTAKVTITGVNDVPVVTSTAADASGAVVESGNADDGAAVAGTPAVSGILTSSDVDKGAVANWSGTADGTYGAFAITTDGKWTYTLNNGASGAADRLAEGDSATETFTATVTDDKGATATQIVTVRITGTNDAPVITTAEGQNAGAVSEASNLNSGAVDGGIVMAQGLLTSSDADAGATATWSGSAAGTYGAFTITADGKWTYTLNNDAGGAADKLGEGENATETFTATVTDDKGAIATQKVTLTVTGANDAPVISIVEDDAAAAALTETNTGLNKFGTLTVTDADLHDTNAVTVEAVSVDGATTGLNADNAALKAMLTLAQNTLAADPGAAHNLTWNFNSGSEAFNYLAQGEQLTLTYTIRASDAHAGDTQDVTITITGTNDAPVINTAAANVPLGESNMVLSSSGAVGFSDADHNAIVKATLSGADVTSFGVTLTQAQKTAFEQAFTVTEDGQWSFKLASPDYLAAGQSAKVTYQVTVKDENDAAATQIQTITVNGSNDAPVAVADKVSGTENQTLTIDVLANDTDADNGHAFTLVSGSAPTGKGEVSIADGKLVFVPGASFDYLAEGVTETVTLSYSMKDEHNATSSSTVTVTITGTNDAPFLSSAQATLSAGQEDRPYTINVTDLLQGYTDVDRDALSVTGLTADHGAVIDNGNGTYTVTPTTDYNGAITLKYSVTDGHDAALATQSFTLQAVNDPATITGNTSGSVTEAGSANNGGTPTVSGDLQSSDVDNAGDAFQAVAGATASANHYGTFTVTAAGVWSYTLDNTNEAVNALNFGSSLSDSFKVYSQDGTEQVVQITINGANDMVPATMPSTYVGSGDPNDYDNATPAAGTSVGAGTSGDDVLVGTSSGGDTLNGGTGDDAIYGYGGNDTISGGNGKDKIYGGAGNDLIQGDNQNDEIYGGSGNDTIQGNSQNDLIFGGSGSDVIKGGDGTDIIYGGYGADQLTGGLDADTFVFLGTRDTNDTITDFAGGVDKIDLSAIDANTGVASDQGFAWGGQQAGETVLAHSVTYHVGTGGLMVLADTDGDVSTAEFMVTLTGVSAVNESDFKL